MTLKYLKRAIGKTQFANNPYLYKSDAKERTKIKDRINITTLVQFACRFQIGLEQIQRLRNSD
jgi:hypothetical protein